MNKKYNMKIRILQDKGNEATNARNTNKPAVQGAAQALISEI